MCFGLVATMTVDLFDAGKLIRAIREASEKSIGLLLFKETGLRARFRKSELSAVEQNQYIKLLFRSSV